MSDPRSTDEGPGAVATGVATGVATSNLGTAANLEETQVFSSAELAAAAAAVDPDAGQRPGGDAHPPRHAAERASPVAAAVAADSAGHRHIPANTAPPAPAAARRVRGSVATRHRASRPPRGRGLAGVLAAALVVLAGVAFVVSQDDGTIDAGQALPSAAAPATTAPDQVGGGDDDNPGKGNGNGAGKGKDCRGNGNGHGCGGGGEGGNGGGDD